MEITQTFDTEAAPFQVFIIRKVDGNTLHIPLDSIDDLFSLATEKAITAATYRGLHPEQFDARMTEDGLKAGLTLDEINSVL